jgi:hypothetical protein
MSAGSSLLPFVSDALARDGAAVEPVGPHRLFVVAPARLREALDLPSGCTLDLAGEPADDARAFPLEGQGMQWLIERARARGRLAGAFLPSPPQNPAGRAEKARARLTPLNATVCHSEATRPTAVRALLEFGYDAQSEERSEGRVHVAVTASGTPSVSMAEALLGALATARAEAPAADGPAIGDAVRLARRRVEVEVDARLAPFREECQGRLEAERERIVAYHDRLVREAVRRRRGADEEPATSRREAILRQRAERLEDLAERHAVSASYWLASTLVVRYEVVRCAFRLRRRRREVDVAFEWDPFLARFLGHPCEACREAATSLYVCDAAGHVTCAPCAARCTSCHRVTCRVCTPGGCACPAGP